MSIESSYHKEAVRILNAIRLQPNTRLSDEELIQAIADDIEVDFAPRPLGPEQ